jgi:hypothetical protein
VAAAVAAGDLGEDHLRVIGHAIDVLPSCVSVCDRDDVERSLVREAVNNDAEIVKALARRIDEIFNPDADYDEADRARRRGLLLGQQGPDGMSRLSAYIDPKPTPTSKPSPPRYAPAATSPTAHWPRSPTHAAMRSAVMTASNSGSRPPSPPAGWGRIAGIR